MSERQHEALKPQVGEIRPEPTTAEVAAIVAAIELSWPAPAAERTVGSSRWRFSGRWWSKPLPVRRDRP